MAIVPTERDQTMGKWTLTRDFYIPKGSRKVADKGSDAVAYLFENVATLKPGAALFWGSQAKPIWHYTFRTEDQREAKIRETFADRRAWLARKAEWAAERVKNNVEARSTVKVGDIFHTSWGYDQTNVEFFEVVGIKGAYATLREIGTVSEGGGPGGERCVPQSGAYLAPRYEGDDRGIPIRRLIQKGGIKIDDVRTAWPWGKRVAGVVVGESLHRTSFGFGH